MSRIKNFDPIFAVYPSTRAQLCQFEDSWGRILSTFLFHRKSLLRPQDRLGSRSAYVKIFAAAARGSHADLRLCHMLLRFRDVNLMQSVASQNPRQDLHSTTRRLFTVLSLAFSDMPKGLLQIPHLAKSWEANLFKWCGLPQHSSFLFSKIWSYRLTFVFLFPPQFPDSYSHRLAGKLGSHMKISWLFYLVKCSLP